MSKKRVISHRDFVRDLGRGARGEDIVEVFLQGEFGIIPDNVSERNPDYDLIIKKIDPEAFPGKKVVPKKLLRKIFRDSFGFYRKDTLTVEVKFDEAAARYKNIFLEVYFNYEDGTPGTIFKCKADVIAWVVPAKNKKFKIHLLDRAKFLAWFHNYTLTHRKKLEYKVPGISPMARGIAVPLVEVVESVACIGVYEFKL